MENGITRAARLLLERWRCGRASGAVSAPIECDNGDQREPAHPAYEDVPGDLERVARMGRQLTCFFARSDPGYHILTAQAGRTVRRLQHAGWLRFFFIEKADHTFSMRAARQTLIDTITTDLCRRYARPDQA